MYNLCNGQFSPKISKALLFKKKLQITQKHTCLHLFRLLMLIEHWKESCISTKKDSAQNEYNDNFHFCV